MSQTNKRNLVEVLQIDASHFQRVEVDLGFSLGLDLTVDV